MKNVGIILLFMAAILMPACSHDATLNRLAIEEYSHPIRKGEPYWNVFAKKFTYAPAFGFPAMEDAVNYEYIVYQEGRRVAAFKASSPSEDLGPIWKSVPPGPCILNVVALDAGKDSIGLAGTREFIRDFPFKAGGPPPAKSFRQTALDAIL